MFSVDLVVAVLPLRVQVAIKMITNIAILLLLGTYVHYGWIMAQINSRQMSSALGLPMFWIYLAIPVGAALIVLALATQTARPVRQRSEGRRVGKGGVSTCRS